jgi:hypothetical protein
MMATSPAPTRPDLLGASRSVRVIALASTCRTEHYALLAVGACFDGTPDCLSIPGTVDLRWRETTIDWQGIRRRVVLLIDCSRSHADLP